MVSFKLHHNGLNGILTDEMVCSLLPSKVISLMHPINYQRLGKTLQTISFLSYLKHHRDIPGLHLIFLPKSTLQNWQRSEFDKWTPDVNVIILMGTIEGRTC
jgi:SWI/SNF-related matrix-associated actin-dependent regulator of chromatin subfamily A member 5